MLHYHIDSIVVSTSKIAVQNQIYSPSNYTTLIAYRLHLSIVRMLSIDTDSWTTYIIHILNEN